MKRRPKRKMEANRFVILIALIIPVCLHAQDPDSLHQPVNSKRLRAFIISSGAGYGITLIGLNELWYKDSGRQSFRFFNDNSEWKQVDKMGHFYSSFYLSYGTSRALKWCNLPAKKSNLIGALTGFLVLIPIELLDGFSEAYGASSGDLIANFSGPAFYLGQSLLWNEVRIHPKFSFHQTNYAAKRPELLGRGLIKETFKDYNGQTYWLSIDIDKFIKFPKWLNIAIGYGAHGMVAARDEANIELGYDPYRQYYLSIDPDLTAIRTNSKAVKTLIFIANMIKIPSPTISFSSKGCALHVLYF